MNDSNGLHSKLSENAWLAMMPILATYLAFLFQGSYFAYFGVPMSLIDIDVPKIIFSMAALVVAGFLALMLFAAVADTLRSQNPIIRIFGRGLLGVVLFSPFIIAGVNFYTIKQNLFFGGILFVIWMLNFLPPPQKAGEFKSYLERLREQEERYGEAIAPKNVKQMFGERVIAPFSLIVLLSIYVMMLGGYCASVFGGTSHLKDNPGAIYVGKANGAYIFTIVDPKTNAFGNQVLLISDGEKIELVRGTNGAIKHTQSR